MADSQSNFISKFAPKSHFFTDPEAISQSEAQAFGPASATEFRVTSSFTISGSDANAYAICRGVVLVQPQSDTKVNIVIRPFTQPIQGFNIKYFIYRGLNIDDFFTGDKVTPADVSASDFINSINASFAAYHHSIDPDNPVPDFMAKFIGFDPAHQDSTLPLSDFFFKESHVIESGGEFNESSPFELPNVPAGSSLGTFVPGECGIDIVLDYGDYRLPEPNDEFVFDLAYARLPKCSIVPADPDAFKQKLIKEQIFQFLDVAAYFGFHAIDTGAVTMNVAGAKVDKKGGDIYTLMVSKFFTKNRLYLYIQSDRTRSYNFYGNYAIEEGSSNCLKYGIAEDALTEQPYETNGWPLIINDTPQNHSDNLNTFYLQLITDNNVNTMLYGQVAQISNAQSNNFCGPDNLRLAADDDGTLIPFTKVLNLVNAAIGPENAKLNIATFNIVIYQGKVYHYIAGQVTDDQDVTTDILQQPDFFDDVFDIINAEPLLVKADNIYSSMNSKKVKLINHYYKYQLGISAVQTNVVNDVLDPEMSSIPTINRVIYITNSIDILSDVTSISNTITADTRSNELFSTVVTGSKTYILPVPFYYDLISFTDNFQLIKGPALRSTDGKIPDKIILGLSKVENDLLKNLIVDNNLIRARLFLINLFDQGVDLISPEKIIYQKYNLGVVGETPVGELKLCLNGEDITVYSLDRKYHFSVAYADKMKSNPIVSMFMDLEITI